MPDYICKQKLLQEINSAENRKADNLMADWYYQMVNNQPDVNVKKEVYAYWEETGFCNSTGDIYLCSNCGGIHNPSDRAVALGRQDKFPRYCPNCGARMDKEENR